MYSPVAKASASASTVRSGFACRSGTRCLWYHAVAVFVGRLVAKLISGPQSTSSSVEDTRITPLMYIWNRLCTDATRPDARVVP